MEYDLLELVEWERVSGRGEFIRASEGWIGLAGHSDVRQFKLVLN